MATKGVQVELLLGGAMDNGDVALAEGKVFTYAAGTLTNKTTWTDRDKTTPATNPIILDAAGQATIFADGVYKFVIKDADNVTIRTIDNLEFGQTFTGMFNLSKGVDISSANALVLGSDGNYFDVTGTTTINSIGAVGIGTVVKLHFDSALTLTHNATNLILPGAKDITTAAGDEAEFIEYASGDWICTNYQKANGNPVINSIVRQLKGADVASVNALVLGSDGNYFDITGTTAITSIGSLGIGTIVKLHFDAILTLTHDANDLILPEGVDIITAAGDEAEFIEYASGDWICTNYQNGFASDAEVKTGTEANKGPSVLTMQAHEGVCKAWVNFNGTGAVAIADSFNVSSVTDDSVGLYTINWDTDFSNASYCVTGIVRGDSGSNDIILNLKNAGVFTVAACQINTRDVTAVRDVDLVCVSAFGDQ